MSRGNRDGEGENRRDLGLESKTASRVRENDVLLAEEDGDRIASESSLERRQIGMAARGVVDKQARSDESTGPWAAAKCAEMLGSALA